MQNKKKAVAAILVSDKTDFKAKAIKKDKEGHYIMIKGSIQEEDIILINIYALNRGKQNIIRLYYEQLYINDLDNRNRMGKYIETVCKD